MTEYECPHNDGGCVFEFVGSRGEVYEHLRSEHGLDTFDAAAMSDILSEQITARRSVWNPEYFVIYHADGRPWRVCHASRIDAKLRELRASA